MIIWKRLFLVILLLFVVSTLVHVLMFSIHALGICRHITVFLVNIAILHLTSKWWSK